MASQKLTGVTKKEMLEMKVEHPDDHEWEFEEMYCLREIGRQPDDYEGPQRYCINCTLLSDDEEERSPLCRFHGGWEGGTEKGLEAADPEKGGRQIQHGMYAEDKNLKENWDEADQKLYDRIMSWAEDYGWEEGSEEYTLLEDLALSKVREMRSEVYLNEEGELVTRYTTDPETGEVHEEEDTHPLKNDLRLQKQTILDMMKELGLTPKAKSSMDSEQTEADAFEQIAGMAEEALEKDDDKEFDPERFED